MSRILFYVAIGITSPVGGVRADKILLVLNEFRYGVKGKRGLRDS